METTEALIDEAVKIAREREETLRLLRCALIQDNMEDVKKYSACLCGLVEINGQYVS